MATPTRPCPYCGQQVLMTAPHCGYCGRPLPAAAAPPAGGGLAPPAPGGRSAYPPPAAPAGPAQGNAKTMFGYAPPPGQAWPPAPGAAPPAAAPPPAAPAPAPWGQPSPSAPHQAAPAPAPWGAPQPARGPAPQAAPPPGFAPPGQAPQQNWQPAPQGQPPQGQPPQWQQPPAYQPPPGQPQQWQPPPQGQPPQGQAPQWQQPPAYQPPPGQPQQWQPPPQGGGPLQGQNPQQWQPPPQGQPQQWQQPPQGQPQQWQQPAGAAPAWASNVPQVDLSAGLKFLRDQAFEKKALMVAAIALVATRFMPLYTRGETVMAWDGNTFLAMVFPLIAAAIYAAVIFLPEHVKAQIPRPALKWAPFIVAYLGSGLLCAAVPPLIFVKLADLGGSAGGMGVVAWTYPVLLFGLVLRMQDPNDKVARGMVGLGGLIAAIGVLTEVGGLFEFSHKGTFMIIFQLLAFLVLLVMVASLVFAVPTAMWPPVAQFERFLPLVVLVLVAWVPLAALLMAMEAAFGDGGEFMNLIYLLSHMLAVIVGFLGILLLTAPEAIDSLKQALAAPQGGPPPGYGPPPGAPPGGYGGPPPQQGPPPGYGPPPQGGGYGPPQ